MDPVTPATAAPATDDTVTAVSSSQPWWVAPLMKYGVGSVIGIYLVWWLTHTASAQLGAMNDKLDTHVSTTHELVATLTTSAEDENRYRKAMLTLQIMNCKANQKTEEGKTSCEAVRAIIEK